jgi:hypothetical protein
LANASLLLNDFITEIHILLDLIEAESFGETQRIDGPFANGVKNTTESLSQYTDPTLFPAVIIPHSPTSADRPYDPFPAMKCVSKSIGVHMDFSRYLQF